MCKWNPACNVCFLPIVACSLHVRLFYCQIQTQKLFFRRVVCRYELPWTAAEGSRWPKRFKVEGANLLRGNQLLVICPSLLTEKILAVFVRYEEGAKIGLLIEANTLRAVPKHGFASVGEIL